MSIWCVWGISLLFGLLSRDDPQARWESHRVKLQDNFLQVHPDSSFMLPPVYYVDSLPANARYTDGQILVGNLQKAYKSQGDSLSVLFHEYQHAIWEDQNRYPLACDSQGDIPQWDTGLLYYHEADSEEVAWEIRWIEEEQGQSFPDKQKADWISMLSRPQPIPFVYAPSNLAREELAAYQEQLQGADKGYYQLSPSGRYHIHSRIRQLEATLQRRLSYEAEKGLKPDGGLD